MAAPDPRALHESVRVRGDGLDTAKRRIIREAHRLLADTGGRYGIHELCLLPEDLDPEHAEEITRDLGAAIHVGARPLTPRGWAAPLAAEGFTVTAHRRTPMALLEPRRLISDERFTQTLGIAGRALRDPAPCRRSSPRPCRAAAAAVVDRERAAMHGRSLRPGPLAAPRRPERLRTAGCRWTDRAPW